MMDGIIEQLDAGRQQTGENTKTMNKRKRRRRWLRNGLLAVVLLCLLPVLVFRWVPPPASAVMLQRSWSESQAQDYRWTALEDISPHMALAVVAAEDQKFPSHFGFDFASLRDAVSDGSRGEPLRGASTISQQVARNLFLWQGRSYLRKLLEAWFTLLLEAAWPKSRILEVYLNIAETGPQTFGVEAAAQRFFGRPASLLGPEQSALIAASLPNPRRMQASRPSAYMLERQQWILEQMNLLGGTRYLGGILR